MKIIHVYDGHERVFTGEGSVPTIVYKLAKHTAKKGHEVIVIERRWVGTAYEDEIDGIKFIRFDLNICSNISNKEIVYTLIKKPEGTLRFIADRCIFALKTNNCLRHEDFDVIHVHLPFAANILVNINKDLREKMVYTAHVGDERKRFALDPSAPLALKLFSPDLYLMERVRKGVVLNEPLKKKLIEKGIPEEKLEVIPNGVDIEDFYVTEEEIEKVKRKYELEGVVVMFAGTVTPRKGVLELMKAAELLNRRDVLFLVVGNLDLDRKYARRVVEYAKCKGINAKFTGIVPYEDLKVLYSACDIFVLPSFEEGQPLVLLEAMASGKPLIGSKVGGIPMQIIDGWNGLLIRPGDIRGLAEKIRYLIENEEERKRMGKNSRELAEREFSYEKIVEKYVHVYEEVQVPKMPSSLKK
jgi:glycosyltransferase involved in cell wall biosynthesis